MTHLNLGAVALATCLALACSSDDTTTSASGGATATLDGGGNGARSGANMGSGGNTSPSPSGTGGTAPLPTGGSGGAPNGGSPAGGTGGTAGTTAGAAGTSTGGNAGAPPGPGCPPLPAPTGATIEVAPIQATDLDQFAYDAPANTTLVLAAGTYTIDAPIQLRASGVTLRSATDDATTTVIDATYTVAEAVVVTASDVTVAHVTITRAIDHPIHVYTDATGADVTGTHVYGVHLVDGGEQLLKVNPGGTGGYVDRGLVECSEFRLTDAGRPNIEPCCGGCYTGGIDVHAGWDWVVRNNRFEDIYCDGAGLAEHAVHFWKGARGTLVENNVILGCARGIGFGLSGGAGDRVYPDRPSAPLLAHYDGVIRNNVLWADHPYYDTGIELDIASRPAVVHNTVLSGAGATGFFSSIDYRFAETDAYIANNLTRRVTARDGATATLEANLEGTPLDLFVDAPGGDFHLLPTAASAIDQGVVVNDSGVDLDGTSRTDGAPDLGADELGP